MTTFRIIIAALTLLTQSGCEVWKGLKQTAPHRRIELPNAEVWQNVGAPDAATPKT